MSHIYECALEVPAWTTESEAKRASEYRPRLILNRYEYSLADPELLVRISAWIDDLPSRDRWVVQFYPPDEVGLFRQNDDGDYWKPRRWPRRLDPELSEGELRHPRETAAAAIKLSFELLGDLVPKADLAAMEKVATILRPQLEQTTRAFATRFRPATRR